SSPLSVLGASDHGSMRILHTADWHIGRTFHGHSTLNALGQVLEAIPRLVREREIDVVLAAGDMFDSAVPSADAFTLLQDTLVAIRAAGARVILISGNHDSAARLGFNASFARFGEVHIVTDPEAIGAPITIADRHGEVDFHCVPFLEPALIRHRWPEAQLRNQADALAYAMQRVRASMAPRPQARSVVLAHTFAAGGEAESSDSERAITVGTVDAVPLRTFDGADYVALGHIHGRMRLAEHIRYSGAMLHYSFSEAAKPRGAWLVELDHAGLSSVEWVDLPVPRPLVVLRGELEDLLTSSKHERYREHWVSAILTDSVRPADAMRRLQSRFAWCAHLEHRPVAVRGDGAASYAERVQGKSDEEILDAFLEHVRSGEGVTEAESELFADLLAEQRAEALTR
ncbi:MAG TPA: exonuclease SbcCD subunit D, partial [Solirubrobacteraceae bacterium]|nr:exonuclease SbcCD subunit D [Solirubrobacteraceae bacterium]